MKIVFVGDVMLGGILSSGIKKYKNIFLSDEVRESLKADVVFCNLESVLSDKGIPLEKNKILLQAKEGSIELLKSAGFNAVSLANNHIMDFGYNSLLKTIKLLKKNNIKYTGAGANLSEACKPIFFEKDNLRIGLIAYATPETWGGWGQRKNQTHKEWIAGKNKPGVALFNLKLIEKEISMAKKKSDFLIVSLYWGEEYKRFPRPEIVSEARKMIDMGADLIIGDHPHILQGYEKYHNGMIFYSLSNFLFPAYHDRKENLLKYWPYRNRQGLIVQCEILKNKTASYKLIPVIQKKHKPIAMIPSQKKRNKILSKIEWLSKEYKDDYLLRYFYLEKRENRFKYIKLILSLYEVYGLTYTIRKIIEKMLRSLKISQH
jgi:poly-gamma-glutamate capsule biosynthesis protein CapA/YwtB (metallophosphatase superfamily)